MRTTRLALAGTTALALMTSPAWARVTLPGGAGPTGTPNLSGGTIAGTTITTPTITGGTISTQTFGIDMLAFAPAGTDDALRLVSAAAACSSYVVASATCVLNAPSSGLLLQSAVSLTPSRNFVIRGPGLGGSTIRIAHTGVGITIHQGSLCNLTGIDHLVIQASATGDGTITGTPLSGPSAGGIWFDYTTATACASSVPTLEMSFLSVIAANSGYTLSTPYPGSFMDAIKIMGPPGMIGQVYGDHIITIPTLHAGPAVSGTHGINASLVDDIELDGFSVSNADVGYWQTGYSEGLRISKGSMIGVNYAFAQNAVVAITTGASTQSGGNTIIPVSTTGVGFGGHVISVNDYVANAGQVGANLPQVVSITDTGNLVISGSQTVAANTALYFSTLTDPIADDLYMQKMWMTDAEINTHKGGYMALRTSASFLTGIDMVRYTDSGGPWYGFYLADSYEWLLGNTVKIDNLIGTGASYGVYLQQNQAGRCYGNKNQGANYHRLSYSIFLNYANGQGCFSNQFLWFQSFDNNNHEISNVGDLTAANGITSNVVNWFYSAYGGIPVLANNGVLTYAVPAYLTATSQIGVPGASAGIDVYRGPPGTSTPTTGTVVSDTLSPAVTDYVLLGSNNLPQLGFVLPPSAAYNLNEPFNVISDPSVSSFTLTAASGDTIVGAAVTGATITPNTAFHFRKSAANTWTRLQ